MYLPAGRLRLRVVADHEGTPDELLLEIDRSTYRHIYINIHISVYTHTPRERKRDMYMYINTHVNV
jgi:hypothetical protein